MKSIAILRSLPQQIGLRERFAFAMGLFVISAGLAVTLLVEWRLTQSLQASARQTLQHLASEVAHDIAADMDRRRLEVARLAVLLGSLDAVESQAVQPLLDALKARQPAYAWIGLADSHGKVMAASDGLLAGEAVDSRPWFAQARSQDYFGDPHRANLLARHMAPGQGGEPPRFYDIASPVRDPAGQWVGVLGAHLYSDWIHAVVRDSEGGRRASHPVEVFVADGQGQWVFAPHSVAGRHLDDLMRQDPDGRFLTAIERVRIHDAPEPIIWTVAVRESVHDAFATVREHRRQMLLWTPLVATLLALGTWWVAGRVVSPVARLAEAARRHAATTGHVLDASVRESRDETRLLDQALNRLALSDPLTGLLNRSALRQHLAQLQQALAPGVRNRGLPFAVTVVDLDDFHVFNSTRGHAAGDQMLRAAAMRLRQLGGKRMEVARLEGDVFALVHHGLCAEPGAASRQAMEEASRVLAAFKAPMDTSFGAFRCPVSVGVSVIVNAATGPEDAIKQAELAMRVAKRSGKDQAALFDESMHRSLLDQAQFEQALRDAVPGGLTVVYQPQVTSEGRMIGVEALVRWNRPGHGPVSPARFIPVAEQTGLIIDIGRWMLDQALAQIKAWEADPRLGHLVIAVNVSAREFNHPGFARHVEERLRACGADPSRLKLELTESALAVDVEEVVARMHALKSLGVSFALDDFGTGFSSLAYLRRMPIDQLKIDQTFVRDILDGPGTASIVRAVVALGSGLGLQVIAEGVETEAQRQRLAELGCRVYQGYLFGAPGPAEALGDRA